MCQGPQVTTPRVATSHNVRRRSQQSQKLVNRKLQAAGADVKIVDGAKGPIHLKSAVAAKAGPSATKTKERARAFQSLDLQQMSEAILCDAKIAADVEAMLPGVSSTVLESTIYVASCDVKEIAADGEAIPPNGSHTVLESTVSVEKLLLQFLKASQGASSQSAAVKTPADECQPESAVLGCSLASDLNPMSVEHSPSLTGTVSHVMEAKDTTKHSRRRVHFDDDACIIHEIAPYAEIYGLHPREFVFGKDYCILPAARYADMGTALRRSMGVMDDEDSESDSDEDEFDASEWEEEYLIF